MATDHCLNHIRRATDLAETIGELKSIPVAAVISIISSLNSTLLITPIAPTEVDRVAELSRQIGSAVSVISWKQIKSGDYWMLRGITSKSVHIDIATMIPNSVPQELNL